MNSDELGQMFDDLMRRFPKAKRVAVENFSMTCSSTNGLANAMNLAADAKLYKWNEQTTRAIKEACFRMLKPI